MVVEGEEEKEQQQAVVSLIKVNKVEVEAEAKAEAKAAKTMAETEGGNKDLLITIAVVLAEVEMPAVVVDSQIKINSKAMEEDLNSIDFFT